MTNLVKVINNEVVTNSVIVAEMFGKEHYNVIRDIETKLNRDFTTFTSEGSKIDKEMIENTKASLSKMYHKSSYKDSTGKNNKMYIMNRDGLAITTKWTQKGRLFLYAFLKNKNVLPLIEQD